MLQAIEVGVEPAKTVMPLANAAVEDQRPAVADDAPARAHRHRADRFGLPVELERPAEDVDVGRVPDLLGVVQDKGSAGGAADGDIRPEGIAPLSWNLKSRSVPPSTWNRPTAVLAVPPERRIVPGPLKLRTDVPPPPVRVPMVKMSPAKLVVKLTAALGATVTPPVANAVVPLPRNVEL